MNDGKEKEIQAKTERIIKKINDIDKKLAESQAQVAIAEAVLALIKTGKEVTVQSLIDWLQEANQASTPKLIRMRNEFAEKVIRDAQTQKP